MCDLWLHFGWFHARNVLCMSGVLISGAGEEHSTVQTSITCRVQSAHMQVTFGICRRDWVERLLMHTGLLKRPEGTRTR